MITGRLSRAQFCAIDLQDYPKIDESQLSLNDRALFRKRKRSIELYSLGKDHDFIFNETGRNRQQVAQDVKRFATTHNSGEILAWSALIPRRRIHPENPDSPRNKKRRKDIIFSRGTFTKLLARYPSIKKELDNTIFGRSPDGKPSNKLVTPQLIHQQFLNSCRNAGLTDRDYPLVTEDRGRRALSNYRMRCLAAKPEAVFNALYGKQAIAELQNQTGRTPAIARPERIYQRIEIDGHELPFVGVIELPGAHPLRPILKAMSEITLVFVVECGVAAILGYSIKYGKNYGSRDVLRAVRKAIVPSKPLDLDPRLGLKYPENSGLPCNVIDELEWALWLELHFDNCIGHLSPFLLSQLPATVPIASPRAAPDTHAVIESVNKVIDKMFKDVACGTAGGWAAAASEAERIGLTHEIVEQIVDVAVATYNSMPPLGSNYTKIELLRRYARDPRSLIARIPKSLRPRYKLYDFEATLSIRGNKRRTIGGPPLSRPFVHFHHGDYTSEDLARRFDLIGKKVVLRGESDDLRTLDCWLADGSSLGRIEVLGPWRLSKHGFETRSAADKLRRRGFSAMTDNPVLTVITTLQKLAATDSRAASQLANVLQETGIHLFTNNTIAPSASPGPKSDFTDPFPSLGTIF